MGEQLLYTEQPSIPEYLHTRGREPDQCFESDEMIYRRFNVPEPKSLWVGNGTLSGKVFPVQNDSYNREKHSKRPEDVLYNTDFSKRVSHFFEWGILSLRVGKIRAITSVSANMQTFTLEVRPVHKPEAQMYPHTEMHLYVDGKYMDKKLAPPSLRTSFRDVLVEECCIIKELDAQF